MESTHGTGEKVYFDEDGVKQNLRGMIRNCPEWVHSRFQHMEKRIAELEAELASARNKCGMIRVCHWSEDDHGIWTGSCGIAWSFEYATTPHEHAMNYCPQCGANLLQQTGGE